MNDELIHYGVLGMKWGVRKDNTSGATRSTERLAAKDAKRYADAKMFYGKTAGTKRKLLKAELDKKKKNVPGYEDAFNKAIEDVDYARSAKKAVGKRTRIDAAYRTRVTIKQFLGVTGPLTVAAASALYFKNKDKVDSFVTKQAKDIMSKIVRTRYRKL